ncbi:gliomedin-like isoform X1 [Mytilus trossulus]|uniref:gliomedin-like isoform X1 n=1 Tax=Mytilus trossulus TaxID=6551 RepID=UPI003003FF2E
MCSSDNATEKVKWNLYLHLKIIYFSLSLNVALCVLCLYLVGISYQSCASLNYLHFDHEDFQIKHSNHRIHRQKRGSFRSYKETLQECAYLTNICKEQNLGLPALKGDKGDQGVRGDKGEFGIYGMTGPRGPPGTAGQPGRDGAKGDKGEKGHEGLLGFPGLKGETGPLGIKGDKGDRGIIGPGGPKGFGGPKGEIGEPGEDGIPGKRGRRGPDGLKGRKGIIGIDGPQGHTGPKGQKGENGELGVPGYRIACNCPSGEKGDKGQRGLIGFTGYKGDKGSDGLKGDTGFGLRGLPGTPGKPGSNGDTGDKGSKGACVVSSPLAMESWRINSDSPSSAVQSVRKLKMIGIPLFLRRSGPVIGSWIRDSALPNNYYVTYDFYGSYVYQYTSTENFKSDKIDRTHDLRRYHYYGNSHVVFNGSLYYHRSGESTIVRFDLTHGAISTVQKIHGASYNDSNYLYAKSHVYFDLEFDENGLWAIYRKPRDEKGLHIMKIDPLTMQNIKTWRLEVDPTEYGNGFIAGGILYLVRDITKTKSTLDYAYDLYTDKQYKVPTPMFRNPYKYNTMINYFPRNNARDSRLLAWDNGVQMEYALLF